jgi:hypothetical protein
MRIHLLMFIAALGLVGSAMAQAPAAATAAPSKATDSGQPATWTQLKLLQFSPPRGLCTGQRL